MVPGTGTASAPSALRSGDRLLADRATGLLSYDAYGGWNESGTAPRWNVLWLENRVDCRIWSYYCDLRKAMAQLHKVFPASALGPDMPPDLIVVGPRMATNTFRATEPLGISRARWAHVPLVVIQNKMYGRLNRTRVPSSRVA